jgi:uncharacterized damage-inducible protein DinB
MNWTELLKSEIEYTYRVTEALMALVDDSKLNWKPSTGSNWMTTGQLLRHLTESCGGAFRGFVTGNWSMPEAAGETEEAMLPPAEQMPTVKSVAEARELLKEDKMLALSMLEQSGEKNLAGRKAPAPWDPTELILGHRLLQMVSHMTQHKGQLFYYLKLQGKPVNTSHLWGM